MDLKTFTVHCVVNTPQGVFLFPLTIRAENAMAAVKVADNIPDEDIAFDFVEHQRQRNASN